MQYGLIKLYGRPDVMGFSCQFGRFVKNDDGSVEVPESALEIALTHGFFRTREQSLAPPPMKLEDVYRGRMARHAEGEYEPPLERVQRRAAPKISPEERVASANRFELREYLEGNEIPIPSKANNEVLRALVLEHMKAEAAGEAGGVVKAKAEASE